MNAIVIFSIAGALGALTLPSGQVSKARLEPYPDVVALMRALHAEGVSIGVEIPDERFDRPAVEALLGAAGLKPLVHPALIQTAPFMIAGTSGKPVADPEQKRVFVSADRFARARVSAATSFRSVPHPSLVRAALRDEDLFYVRAKAKRAIDRDSPRSERFPWPPIVDGIELVPLHVAVENGHPVLYAAAGEHALEHLAKRTSVQRLGCADDLPERTDLVLFQTSFAVPGGAEFRQRLEELEAFVETPDGAVVALDANQLEIAFHPPDDDHGHTLALVPSSTLIQSAVEQQPIDATITALPDIPKIDGALLGGYLQRWIGEPPPNGDCGGAIKSRFLYHEDNENTEIALLCELKRILGNSALRVFPHGGSRHNVDADLMGGSEAASLVIVSAHLDSTANRSEDQLCEEASDTECIAPGADDDASGIAAVLSIAHVLQELARTAGAPKRTIRFVLFNAEEQGRFGSKQYAHDLAVDKTDVRAVFQLDMIGKPCLGTSPCPPWTFEIHMGGAEVPQLDELSHAHEVMAKLLENAAGALKTGLFAQRFPVPPCYYDPGALRSDHSSFHQNSIPAVYLSEVLWTHDCPGEMLPHPTYHKKTDRTVDTDYAAAIARAVAGAAWLVANQ